MFPGGASRRENVLTRWGVVVVFFFHSSPVAGVRESKASFLGCSAFQLLEPHNSVGD